MFINKHSTACCHVTVTWQHHGGKVEHRADSPTRAVCLDTFLPLIKTTANKKQENSNIIFPFFLGKVVEVVHINTQLVLHKATESPQNPLKCSCKSYYTGHRELGLLMHASLTRLIFAGYKYKNCISTMEYFKI